MENNKKENKEKSLEKNAFGVIMTGILVMLAAAVFCMAYFLLMMRRTSLTEERAYAVYDKHYVFITDNTEREFWNEVFEAAEKEAEEENVYVERLGDNLNASYSTKDILRVAVNSSVDGIMICGQDDNETVSLINRAVGKGIPVVCMRRDIDDSERQCFVGVNSYDLGLEYGKQILEIMAAEKIEDPKIYILADNTMTESMRNLITLAIQDSVSEAAKSLSEIELIAIDTSDAFSAEEAIRDIFIDEQALPDIMVCLNSIFTQCTYQAAVDYNRVGAVKILGYYSAEPILEAIEKKIVYSTVKMDTEEMGIQSVRTLTEYGDTGYASSYIPVKAWVIDRQEAEKILQEARKNAEN